MVMQHTRRRLKGKQTPRAANVGGDNEAIQAFCDRIGLPSTSYTLEVPVRELLAQAFAHKLPDHILTSITGWLQPPFTASYFNVGFQRKHLHEHTDDPSWITAVLIWWRLPHKTWEQITILGPPNTSVEVSRACEGRGFVHAAMHAILVLGIAPRTSDSSIVDQNLRLVRCFAQGPWPLLPTAMKNVICNRLVGTFADWVIIAMKCSDTRLLHDLMLLSDIFAYVAKVVTDRSWWFNWAAYFGDPEQEAAWREQAHRTTIGR